MEDTISVSTNRVVLAIGIGTCLSLLGDTSMYAVLPTHAMEAGVTLASVGILLSANRFIRLLLNEPAGIAFERWSHRWLFVSALYLGACSTALYGVTVGFWPLFAARVLWGISWVGIWIGGNTICLSVTNDDNRGRWIGLYYLSFFLGAACGGMMGGILTDHFGYHAAMLISASLTFLGATVALILLPETNALDNTTRNTASHINHNTSQSRPKARTELVAASVLLGLNRLAFPGFLLPTFGLFMFEQLGDPVLIAGRTIGVTTLTGLGLGLSTLVSMISAPIAGGISDRIQSRWRTIAGSFVPGIIGFTLLSIGKPLTILFGVPLSAITSGSSQGLSTSLIGDSSVVQHRGRRLGIMFTVGDLMSAIGPPLAYALLPHLGVRRLYSILVGLFSVMLFVSAFLGSKQKESQPSIAD